VVKHYTVKMK